LTWFAAGNVTVAVPPPFLAEFVVASAAAAVCS
jgi:hypothetical protein